MAKEKEKTEKIDRKDYEEEDVRRVFALVDFHFWGEVVDWVKKNGVAEADLTSDQAQKLINDFQKLRENGTSFTNDPEEAYRLAKGLKE